MGRPRPRRSLALFGLLLCACGAGEGDVDDAGPRARGEAVVGGRVVSTVDGHPIDLDTVVHAVRSAGVEQGLALRRLQDEELVSAAAIRAGWGDDREVVAAARRAAVQALLARTVEAEVTEASLDQAAVAAAYEAAPDRFARPERRRSVHALVRLPPDAPVALVEAAERRASALHAEVAAAEDPEAAVLALEPRLGAPSDEEAFEVAVEDLFPVTRDQGLDPAYAEALFAAEIGLIPSLVRSSLGWHVLVVTEISPASRPSPDEALAQLRHEALAALRARRLDALIAELARARGVRLEPTGVDRIMRVDELGMGGP